MTTRKQRAPRHTWGLAPVAVAGAAAVVVLALGGCAHRPEPGEKVVDCGRVYQLRAKQVELLRGATGVATVRIVVAGRHENVPNSQIGFAAPSGRFSVEELPRDYAYTNSGGYLLVEWHPAEDSESDSPSEPTTLTFRGLELPGDCSLELAVDPRR